MQERVERWLNYWLAMPISWLIFWLWVALKYAWLRAAWCAIKLREKWAAWCAKSKTSGTSAAPAQLPFVALKRGSKREVAQK